MCRGESHRALFASRETLLMALYDDIMADLQSAILATIALGDQPLEEKIPLAVHVMIQHYLADDRRARVGVLESVGVSAAMERRRRGAIHDMARVLESYLNVLIARGELPAHDYHLLSVALVGGINELLAEWLMVPTPPSIKHLSNEITRILHALIRGSALLPLSLAEPSA